MRELGIDIETYSSADLTKCGVYRYVEADDFTILLFGYCVDGGEVKCVDLASGESLPDEVVRALTDPEVTKTAFNASFERVCISKYLGIPLMDPAQWQCTMVRAARLGLPLSLGQCAEVLGLEEGKMAEGRNLIRYFSKPSLKGERHMPSDAPDRWETFKAYNVRDVEVEQAILRKVRWLSVPEFDAALAIEDQVINDRGVAIDINMVRNAVRLDDEYKAELLAEAKAITGLENPNSPTQIKQWLHEFTGLSVESLRKQDLDDIIGKLVYWPKAQRALRLRQLLGKTSTAKYKALLECVCRDGRVHGLLQFYGAARTGRWAGRLVQVQNLPQNHLTELDYARSIVKAGDLEEFEANFSNPTQVLSELIRTAFVAKDGYTYHVCDFSAIEARVIAWLAGEKWVLDVFRNGGDIYCATASQMFGVPVEKHGRNAELRQKGKIAVLALGYGGGLNALEAMGASRLGLSKDECLDIIHRWRTANQRIVKLWSVVEKAVTRALNGAGVSTANRGIEMSVQRGVLTIKLPSGRRICYPRARLTTDEDGRDVIEYEGMNQTTKKWCNVRTYGGKLTENIVQSIARDILGEVILRAEAEGLKIVFHIHDEIIVEAMPHQTLADVERLFSEPIKWCDDLPLKGAGYTTPYYKKD